MSYHRHLSLFAVLAAGVFASLPIRSFGDENLTDSQVDRALEAIWLRTPSPEKRSADSAKRAALEAYLKNLGPGTSLVTSQNSTPKESSFAANQFHAEVITATTGYIRIGAFLDDLAKRLEPELRDFEQIGVRSIILDLRATSAQGTLALAGEIASFFLPDGTEAFQIQSARGPKETIQTQRRQMAPFRVLILTGVRTAGPVEALAAALRAHGGALVIGVSTQGQAADFELVPLGKDTFLRMPVREALVRGNPKLVPDGLHPDIICNATPEETDAALLKEAQEGRVANLLKETERPRLNEAALLANKNPETEAWIQTQLNRSKQKAAPFPKDAALLKAMDLLVGWEALYGRHAVLP